MFNYVVMAGSGAITYLLAQKGSEMKSGMWYKEVIVYLMYVMLDMLAVYFCMTPLGRVIRVDNMTSGVTELQYGNIAILFSIAIAVVMGLVCMAVKKKMDIRVEVKEK